MDVRMLHWWQTAEEAALIERNGKQLNIAHSVTNEQGETTYNVVWQCLHIAPSPNGIDTTTIKWAADYAFNWTTMLPTVGMAVTPHGEWQSCAPGQSYNLDPIGIWQQSSDAGRPNWLGIGHISLSGIHIIVGIKNVITGRYDTIYIDPTPLPVNSSAAYRLTETAYWWIATPVEHGTICSSSHDIVDDGNFSLPNPVTGKHELWATFQGRWINSPTAPPSHPVVRGG